MSEVRSFTEYSHLVISINFGTFDFQGLKDGGRWDLSLYICIMKQGVDSGACWPLWLLRSSSLTPLFFPISSSIVNLLRTPKILQLFVCFSYLPFLPNFSIWRSSKICWKQPLWWSSPLSPPNNWDLTDVLTHDSILCAETLCIGGQWFFQLRSTKMSHIDFFGKSWFSQVFT